MSLKTAGLWDCISKDKVPLELSNFEPIPPREVWCSTLGSFDWKLNVEYVLAFFFSLSSLVHSRKCTNYLKKLRVPCWDFDGDKELNFQKIYKKTLHNLCWAVVPQENIILLYSKQWVGIVRQVLQNIQVEGGFSALDSSPQPHSLETYPELLLQSEIIQKWISISSVLILLMNSETGRKEGKWLDQS